MSTIIEELAVKVGIKIDAAQWTAVDKRIDTLSEKFKNLKIQLPKGEFAALSTELSKATKDVTELNKQLSKLGTVKVPKIVGPGGGGKTVPGGKGVPSPGGSSVTEAGLLAAGATIAGFTVGLAAVAYKLESSFISLALKSAEFGKELKRESIQLGLSTDQVQKTRNLATASGTDPKALLSMVAKMEADRYKAVRGPAHPGAMEAMTKMFYLGVGGSGKSLDSYQEAVFKRLKSIKDPIERRNKAAAAGYEEMLYIVEYAMDNKIKSFKEALLSANKSAVNLTPEEAASLSGLDTEYKKMTDSITGTFAKAVAAAAPELKEAMLHISNTVKLHEAEITTIIKGLAKFSESIADIIGYIAYVVSGGVGKDWANSNQKKALEAANKEGGARILRERDAKAMEAAGGKEAIERVLRERGINAFGGTAEEQFENTRRNIEAYRIRRAGEISDEMIKKGLTGSEAAEYARVESEKVKNIADKKLEDAEHNLKYLQQYNLNQAQPPGWPNPPPPDSGYPTGKDAGASNVYHNTIEIKIDGSGTSLDTANAVVGEMERLFQQFSSGTMYG